MNLFSIKMRLLVLLGTGLLAMSCASTEKLLVKQFTLRNEQTDPKENLMLRMEKQEKLFGAVSMQERKQRLGQYYTMLWNDASGVGTAPVRVVFLYQQAQSTNRIKRMEQTFSAATPSGKAEFAVRGDDYFKRGRVLAWKATLYRGQEELASQQSYLWQ
ncbi:MAG: hypothetical protein EAZ42_06940 [Verrucomicrobia bacterium]|nr:MAG: hypothetical protein EAZ42_06940 [Verrucomicrobiota bacterium]